MFQTSLLRVRVAKGKIFPLFVRPEGQDLELAQALIDTYSMMVGMKKGTLDSALKEIEEGRDYKLVRGLSVLIERGCRFEVRSQLEPFKARSVVFRLASGRYLQREEVLSEAASTLGVTVQALEESLWSDLEENLLLAEFNPIDPVALVKNYNLSLAQTLLFRSYSLEFSVSDHWKDVFRAIKWLGLMYTVRGEPNNLTVRVEGPLSLTKLTDKYGTSMAKLLEIIIRASKWEVKADVISSNKEHVYKFEISSDKEGRLMQSNAAFEDKLFDSDVEKKFYSDFASFNSGWNVKREPEPIVVGENVFIPDFSFEKYGHKVYLEIVGFWTPNYLANKAEKLKRVSGVDILVAVDEDLGGSPLKASELLYFKKRVPAEKVYLYLKGKEEALIEQTIQGKKISFTGGPVIELKELAEKNSLSIEALKKLLSQEAPINYVQVGDELVSQDYFDQLKSLVDQLDQKSFSQVDEVLKKNGISEVDAFLKKIGYTVIWHSLDPSEAVLQKGTRASAHLGRIY